VSIEAGNELVDMIKPLCKSTRRSGADGDIGGFGGVFDLAAAGYGGLANSSSSADDDTVLVSGTDGVGTKLLLAIDCAKFDTVGIDLVAMCVNDVIVQGAEPLYFLDYAATGKLEPAAMTAIVSGVAKGCVDSNCALIGGETAEMPQMCVARRCRCRCCRRAPAHRRALALPPPRLSCRSHSPCSSHRYADGHFDLAGFSVGAVKRGAILPRLEEVRAGDVIIGCASSGVHSNGFSMVRKIITEGGHTFGMAAPFAAVGGDGSESLVEALLVPTRLYVLSVLNAIKAGDALDAGALAAPGSPPAGAAPLMKPQTHDGPRGAVGGAESGHAIRALCHITGGGLPENMPRILPDGFGCELDVATWKGMMPPVFSWLAAQAEALSGGEGVCDRAALQNELLRTFNCGVGFVVIVKPSAAPTIVAALEAKGEKCAVIGSIVTRASPDASQVVVRGSIFE
jgi:phosphoribosylformylglycinamidine cyclo-ligase